MKTNKHNLFFTVVGRLLLVGTFLAAFQISLCAEESAVPTPSPTPKKRSTSSSSGSGSHSNSSGRSSSEGSSSERRSGSSASAKATPVSDTASLPPADAPSPGEAASAAMAALSPVPTPESTPTPAPTPVVTPALTPAPPVPSVAKVDAPVAPHLADTDKASDRKKEGVMRILQGALWGFVGLVLVMVVYWGRAIVARMERARKYQEEALLDDAPSVDERLMSELATMHVALLRGSIVGYYEKVYAMVRRLLKCRKLMEDPGADTDKILRVLRTAAVDPGYIDTVESILLRCDAVLLRQEMPEDIAHDKIAKDLRLLVNMRPHTPGGHRKEKHAQASPEGGGM